MSEIRQGPLHGAALYNPHLHGKQELVGLFIARRKLLELLLDDLRSSVKTSNPQHHLVIGQRGMGKTMLLHRLAFAIEDEPKLAKIFLPLTFPEEQYNVARLSDFWLNCTDALSDLLERTDRSQEAEKLDLKAEALRTAGEERRAEESLALLTTTAASLDRRLVLLVDNIDLIFDRIKKQDWALREALSSCPSLVLVGASASAVESAYTYGEAFYDFFRFHELEGLDLEETRALILHYAERWNSTDVKRIATEDPTRIQVLHTLTGGNPRTVALLFNVLALGVDGDVMTDLERLLDQCTPLYKARVEALAPQSQQVVHALAVHWDPVSAGELADQLTMDINTVSAQLARLVKEGVVEKVPYEPESRTGFQIAERFFNIWYLMRASRRVRRRLLWLVEFLKTFYSQDQLRVRALLHIESGLDLDSRQRLRFAEYGFALADAIEDRTWRESLETSGLQALLGDAVLRSQLPDLVDLNGEPKLQKRTELQERLEAAHQKVLAIRADRLGWSAEDFWVRLRDSLQLPLSHKVAFAESLEGNLELLGSVSTILERESRLADLYLCPTTFDALVKAVRSGLMDGLSDVEGASVSEAVWGLQGLKACSLAEAIRWKFSPKMLSELGRSLATATSSYPFIVWLQHTVGGKENPAPHRVQKVLRRLITVSSGNGEVISEAGRLLIQYKRYSEAEELLRDFLKIHPEDAAVLLRLGALSGETGHLEEAERALRRAVEIEPEREVGWTLLCILLIRLNRFEEAEQAARRALAVKADANQWALLGATLSMVKKPSEAEAALRQAVALESKLSSFWHLLGAVFEKLDLMADAELAYRKTIEIAPQTEFVGAHLARLLFRRGDFRSASEVIENVPVPDREWYGISATLLTHEGDWAGAIAPAKKFIAMTCDQKDEMEWSRALDFFREAVRIGKARELLQILEETGAAEQWRPLAEALEAVARGSVSYLRRVAPEVRQPARVIYDLLLETSPLSNAEAATAPAASRRRKRPGRASEKLSRRLKGPGR